MKLISFEDTGLAGDNRERPLREVARLEIQVFVVVPTGTLNKLGQPGWHPVAADWVQEKLAESDSVGELLRKVDKYTEGAVVRVSGR